MADRTWVCVYVSPETTGIFLSCDGLAQDEWEEWEEIETGWFRAYCPESNCWDDLEDAASKGCVFLGVYGPSYDWGSVQFFSEGKELISWESSFQGEGVVIYDPNNEEELEKARDFLARSRALEAKCYPTEEGPKDG